MAADWINKHKGAGRRITDDFADFIIYIAFLVLDTEEWKQRFTSSQKKARSFYTTQKTYWKVISFGTATPEVKRICLLCLPNLNPEEHFPPLTTQSLQNVTTPQATPNPRLTVVGTQQETQPPLRLIKKGFSLKIAIRLCDDWRLDPRWDKLLPCSSQLLYRLIFRTYRKDTFRKIKKALSRGEEFFPWCCTGNDSLSKQLSYHPKSSCKTKHYERRQIGRALHQLWKLGFIHRIFRGYEDQGAGKYHVFLNPQMSARFHKSAIEVKKGLNSKKRHSRMS